MKRIYLSLLLLACGFSALAQSSPVTASVRKALQERGARWQTERAGHQTVILDKPLIYPGKTYTKAAQAFLEEFGPALGWDKQDTTLTLRLSRATEDLSGSHYLRYQLYRGGFPELGSACTVAITNQGGVKSYHGRLRSGLPPAPASAPILDTLPFTDLRPYVSAALSGKYPHVAQWTVAPMGLRWTTKDPWNQSSPQRLHLTQTFNVTEPGGYRAERIYLDALTGELILNHQLHCDLNRRLYHRNTAGFNLVWVEGNSYPGSLTADDQEMLTATAEFYNLMYRTFGRRSYDDNNGQMQVVTNAFLSNCPNANAGSNVIRHCTGVVGDDIVGHEWTHNYIRSMNGLIYAFESGAINEAFADIFGECLDLLNDRGIDTNDHLPRTGCNDGNVRWQIAEDATAIDTTLRDYWFPECKEDPSSRESPYYKCVTDDNDAGGVHTNSGLVNRTFALLTDGGIIGPDTIRGIGLTKAMHIFHHANNNYVTQVTDFFALADILVLSATDLLGINLPAPTLLDLPAAASGSIITLNDIEQLEKVMAITQLRGDGPCLTTPTLAQDPPEICASATVNSFGLLLEQTWEDSLLNWEVVEVPGVDSSWEAKPWSITSSLPDGRPGRGLFAPTPRAGDCQNDLEKGVVWLTSPTIPLPSEEDEFVLSFDHYFATQEGYDGGVLYLSLNGAAFALIPNQAFLFNGYNGRLVNASSNDNPLAGLLAFHGRDRNSTSGTWGRSIIDLNAAGARPGDDLRLRWAMGHDGCDGLLGWFLDDIRIGYCGTSALPVTFRRFAAAPAKDHIRLEWATAAEENNAGFYVERQQPDGQFGSLGFVRSGERYVYLDYGVVPGTTYLYRMRQLDLDGTVAYSDLASARLTGAAELRAYPNPVRNELTVTSSEASIASLYDPMGRWVHSVKLTGGRGRIQTAELPAGVYLLRAGTAVLRVVVK